jgi:hypothetical protein
MLSFNQEQHLWANNQDNLITNLNNQKNRNNHLQQNHSLNILRNNLDDNRFHLFASLPSTARERY